MERWDSTVKGEAEETLVEELFMKLGSIGNLQKSIEYPDDDSMQPSAVTKVGGEGCLLGDKALITDTKLKTMHGEVGAGKINNLLSFSLFLSLPVGASHGRNLAGRQKAKGTLRKALITRLLKFKGGRRGGEE